MKFAVIIPTLNAGPGFGQLLQSIVDQTIQPSRKIVIDSSSNDTTVAIAKKFDFEVLSIRRSEFNHGATRQMGVEMASELDYIVFLTQDTVLANSEAFNNLLQALTHNKVGAAYGRQLPHQDASPLGAHARLFNYPAVSRIKSIADRDELGIKTVFISNSFAAYRRSVLQSVGGFPSRVILGEDTFVAAKMLLAGWKISYCADAKVYHSHNYNCLQEMKRYFDIGAFHGSEPWLRSSFGQAEGEGSRYVISELRYLYDNGYKRYIPIALVSTLCKFIGYKIGLYRKE